MKVLFCEKVSTYMLCKGKGYLMVNQHITMQPKTYMHYLNLIPNIWG